MSPASPSSHTPTVLVTGAAKRLGRAMALGLAQAGWRVVVHFHQSAEQAQATVRDCAAFTPGAIGLSADLSQANQVSQLLPAAITQLGHVDAVVNSASVFEHDDAHSFSADSLATHMHVNLTAPVLLAQSLAQHLKSRGASPASGVVVNLLDQKLWNPNPDFLSYTLSKAALEQATTLLAQALAPQIRVVGVAPGLTLTPLGQSSTLEDVVSAVVFACTNRSVTGSTLLVDGGQHLTRFQRDFSMMGSQDA